MDIAIVTGAETPLGLRLIEDLIRQGCRVHGIGNNFSNVTFADKHFIAHAIDLSDLEAVAHTAEAILEKEKAIHILIHAIDVTPGAAFEQLPVGNLEAILKVGLLGPVMLTRLALPNLLRFRGQLINIIPANKSGHIASAVNALIEGGLREMNAALFDQARDAGLRVTNLILRQNTVTDDTTFADKHLQTHIDPEHVARTVEQLLNPNEPNVPNEITLYPRLSGAAEESLPEAPLPIDSYNAIVLPPQEYCPPKQEPIPTREPDQIERTIPYTDEEMEEKIASAIEDYESQPERHEQPKKQKKSKRKDRKPRKPRSEAADADQADSKQDSKDSSERSDQPKSRRGRRRGGRNRNRNRDQKDGNIENHGDERNESPSSDKKPIPESAKESKAEKPPRPGRNRSRKPVTRPEDKYADYNPASAPVPERSKPSSEQPKQDAFQPGEVTVAAPKPKKLKQPAKPKKAPAEKPKQLELVPDAPAVKKKAAKKAAKKATKKTATKKAVKKAAKKAAKKVTTKKAVKKTATKKAAKKAAKKAVKKAKAAE
jgi:NAD(P)-dependent dehydrogenase (short-subunit alcohol dehydrogenase family)